MESRFAHLRQRDTSVSMLRVKVSRRRSQAQKENRDQVLKTRRQLDKLPDLEMSNLSIIQEKTQNNAKTVKAKALEERLKQLERWKERKALEKEKEKREKERKGVFKTGLYQPKDAFAFASVPAAPNHRAKERNVNTFIAQSTRVTRSVKKQAEGQKPLKTQEPNIGPNKAPPAVERSVRTRAASAKSKTCAAAADSQSKSAPLPKEKSADERITRSRTVANSLAPSSGRARNCNGVGSNSSKQANRKELKTKESCVDEEEMVVEKAPQRPASAKKAAFPSFAPEGFTFQAPAGLSTLKFDPLTPRSKDAFLTPSCFFPSTFSFEPETAQSKPSPAKAPRYSPPRSAPPESLSDAKHDVPYFRSEISKETEKLTGLCSHWESKVEDESIPEEMRDRMRTAVGQARLLMKERFKQFGGLVDDCELGRGEKITTCSDLQGFWDMVYYQVEDVDKKFDALKEAEDRGWTEEHKPPPRQKKMAKKPATAPAEPTGTRAAARSRLAAVKAAMKAKQEAAQPESENKDVENETSPSELQILTDGGSLYVKSPTKSTLRRSSRLRAAVLPQASPCAAYLSPRRVSRQTPLALSVQPVRTPVKPDLHSEPTQTPKSRRETPKVLRNTDGAAESSFCFTPVKVMLPDEVQLQKSSTKESESASIPENLHENTAADAQKENLSPVSTSPQNLEVISFTLSPCVTPPESSPAVQVHPQTHNGSVIQEIPGLDFERYLQPSQRCSLSPGETVMRESLSPMATDVEMESPRSLYEEPQQDSEEMRSPKCAGESKMFSHSVTSLLNPHSPQVQTAGDALLLFTPDPKDKIRQSVCPSDLMVFTPTDI